MNVTLYKNISSPNTLNKSITAIRSTISCSLKDNTDIKTPTIRISKSLISDSTSFNYMYIDIFKRYYYTNQPLECVGGILEISGNIDVLMSHKNEIKNLNALVERQQNFYNLYLSDLQIPNLAYKRVQTLKFPNQPLNIGGTMILAVCGKG